jgi:hypothetical protein
MPANRIGRYVIDEVLCEEPLGRVVLARLPELDRAVLIREFRPRAPEVLRERERWLAALDEERKALLRTTDPRCARLMDAGSTPEGTQYVVFDRPESGGYVRLAAAGPRGAESTLRLGVEVGRALAALAGAGLRPAPLDPEWIYIRPDGSVLLAPLGFAHLAPQDGPPAVPERAQVFSVAEWLHTSLTGRPPYAGDPAPDRIPPPILEVSAAVDDVLRIALQPRPEGRYPDVRRLADALEAALPARPAAETEPAALAPSPKPIEKAEDEDEGVEVWTLAVWAAALAGLGAVTGWGLARIVPLP